MSTNKIHETSRGVVAAPDEWSGRNPNTPVRLYDTHPNLRFELGDQVLPLDPEEPPVMGIVRARVAEDRVLVEWPYTVSQEDVFDLIRAKDWAYMSGNPTEGERVNRPGRPPLAPHRALRASFEQVEFHGGSGRQAVYWGVGNSGKYRSKTYRQRMFEDSLPHTDPDARGIDMHNAKRGGVYGQEVPRAPGYPFNLKPVQDVLKNYGVSPQDIATFGKLYDAARRHGYQEVQKPGGKMPEFGKEHFFGKFKNGFTVKPHGAGRSGVPAPTGTGGPVPSVPGVPAPTGTGGPAPKRPGGPVPTGTGGPVPSGPGVPAPTGTGGSAPKRPGGPVPTGTGVPLKERNIFDDEEPEAETPQVSKGPGSSKMDDFLKATSGEAPKAETPPQVRPQIPSSGGSQSPTNTGSSSGGSAPVQAPGVSPKGESSTPQGVSKAPGASPAFEEDYEAMLDEPTPEEAAKASVLPSAAQSSVRGEPAPGPKRPVSEPKDVVPEAAKVPSADGGEDSGSPPQASFTTVGERGSPEELAYMKGQFPTGPQGADGRRMTQSQDESYLRHRDALEKFWKEGRSKNSPEGGVPPVPPSAGVPAAGEAPREDPAKVLDPSGGEASPATSERGPGVSGRDERSGKASPPAEEGSESGEETLSPEAHQQLSEYRSTVNARKVRSPLTPDYAKKARLPKWLFDYMNTKTRSEERKGLATQNKKVGTGIRWNYPDAYPIPKSKEEVDAFLADLKERAKSGSAPEVSAAPEDSGVQARVFPKMPKTLENALLSEGPEAYASRPNRSAIEAKYGAPKDWPDGLLKNELLDTPPLKSPAPAPAAAKPPAPGGGTEVKSGASPGAPESSPAPPPRAEPPVSEGESGPPLPEQLAADGGKKPEAEGAASGAEASSPEGTVPAPGGVSAPAGTGEKKPSSLPTDLSSGYKKALATALTKFEPQQIHDLVEYLDRNASKGLSPAESDGGFSANYQKLKEKLPKAYQMVGTRGSRFEHLANDIREILGAGAAPGGEGGKVVTSAAGEAASRRARGMMDLERVASRLEGARCHDAALTLRKASRVAAAVHFLAERGGGKDGVAKAAIAATVKKTLAECTGLRRRGDARLAALADRAEVALVNSLIYAHSH